MIRLVLSDMDNTLLPFGLERVSRRTIDAIHACQERGIDVGPATGRDFGEIASFFGGDASCYNTGVFVNGQKVYYLGDLVFEKHLDAQALRRTERIMAEKPRCVMVTYRDDGLGDWIGMTREEMGHMYDRAFMAGGERHKKLPEYPVAKAGIICPDDDELTQALVAELHAASPELDFANTVPGWLDVVPHGWNKARGVKTLMERLGLEPHEVCVFGDAENDLAMFDLVPNSCAVANATEATKAAARWHVGASRDDGVAIALEHIAAGEPIA